MGTQHEVNDPSRQIHGCIWLWTPSCLAEIVNKPHPTPNPDGPHTGQPKRGSGDEAGPVPQSVDESVGDENQYDSCFDDMNVTIASAEPDPALKSKSSSDTIPRFVPDSDPISSFLQDPAQQPRTSEIFQSFAPQDAATLEPNVAQEGASVPPLIEISSRCRCDYSNTA